jgi:hypothetical protein
VRHMGAVYVSWFLGVVIQAMSWDPCGWGHVMADESL